MMMFYRMIMFLLAEECIFFYNILSQAIMSVENKHSHASFLPVFLGVFTTFWVPTAASGSVETETHTGLLEWAFPKFMTKILKKRVFRTVSWACFHHVLLGKWLTCTRLRRTAMIPYRFLFAAILNAILEQHLSQEQSINRSCMITLAFLFFGTEGWEAALLLFFPGIYSLSLRRLSPVRLPIMQCAPKFSALFLKEINPLRSDFMPFIFA